jgi:hypothetical protein
MGNRKAPAPCKMRQQLSAQPSVGSVAELEAKLLKAARSLDSGRGMNGQDMFARLRQRSKARREKIK